MERRRRGQPTLFLFAALAAVARASNASDFPLTGTFGYEYTTYNTKLLADLIADYDRFALANNANKSDVTWGASQRPAVVTSFERSRVGKRFRYRRAW